MIMLLEKKCRLPALLYLCQIFISLLGSFAQYYNTTVESVDPVITLASCSSLSSDHDLYSFFPSAYYAMLFKKPNLSVSGHLVYKRMILSKVLKHDPCEGWWIWMVDLSSILESGKRNDFVFPTETKFRYAFWLKPLWTGTMLSNIK